MTDKELAIRARRRLAIMETNDITNDSIEYYKTMVDNFYKQNNIRKTSKSGFSITKNMNVQQRKEMRNIMRSFMKDDQTSIEGIQKEYTEKFKYYSEETKQLEIMPATSVKEMNESLIKLDRTLADRAIKRYLDSDQINAISNHSKSTGISFNKYRQEILSMIKEDINDNIMSTGSEEFTTTNDILLNKTPNVTVFENISDDELIDTIIDRVMR